MVIDRYDVAYSAPLPRHVQHPHHRDRDQRGRQVPRHQEVSPTQLRGRFYSTNSV